MTVGISCLSVHASYICRRSGACCRAGWHISIEPEAVAHLGEDLRRHLLPAGVNARSAMLSRRANGSCTFLEEPIVIAHRGAVGRWLAAKSFGRWIAYQGDGLETITRYLRACLDVLIVEAARGHGCDDRGGMIEAIRRADLLIVHFAEAAEIAKLVNR